jgi:hypothetical protein
MSSHSIAYDLTDAQLAEMLLALDHHRGNNLDGEPATTADLKAWGLGHFQGLVQKYRESVINTANPVSTEAVAS